MNSCEMYPHMKAMYENLFFYKKLNYSFIILCNKNKQIKQTNIKKIMTTTKEMIQTQITNASACWRNLQDLN